MVVVIVNNHPSMGARVSCGWNRILKAVYDAWMMMTMWGIGELQERVTIEVDLKMAFFTGIDS